ncbi:glycosyltransferase family 87 protein [Solwaraspora sp. WMMD1047]|uniref:glycosyltransferase family 87 protein n=1 Tax=Solwaraspora sp. WMMD1047 TaxID=3016102 RepID=UPI002416B90F|nr:glycosyltransferase family 87 protein [Solwaraspora sp. WMMD1047]MDG4829251.1 glycosyltransferase family 87 protein [Solwaraspora sp. WMMD1047]
MPADPAAPPIATDDDPGGRPARRFVWVALLAVLTPVLYLLATPHNFYDLRIYMRAMRWWTDGNQLYDYAQPDRVQGELYFTYPPFAALLLRPFAGLHINVTITIFTVLTVAAVAVTTWWLVTPVADRHRTSRWFAVAVAVPLVLVAESTRETITFGQINMLLVVLILADLLFAVPRGSRWAGVGIGIATALKLFPGIFIVYLLAARRWRAAAVASAAAAGATLLAGAVAPRDSWRFWTHELWSTDRVGRTDYSGNQSFFGLLSRFTAPDKPNQLLWLALVALIAGYGLWRAARAMRAGDAVAGLTLTGLVGALISPISWTHHVYWFMPAVLVLVDEGLRRRTWATPGARRPVGLLVLGAVVYVCVTYGVVSYHDWGVAPERTDSPVEFVLRNVYVLLALLLLAVLPTRDPHWQPGGAPAVRLRQNLH